MPRTTKRGKPQAPGRRRIKAHEPADWAHRRTKARFPFSLFSNVKLFYLLGALIMGASVLAGGILALPQNSTQDTDFVTPVPEHEHAAGTAQPTAGATVAPTVTVKTYAAPPVITIDSSKQYVAVIHTAKGDVSVQLLPGEAPQTVNNFVFLARDGFYNNLSFHRVIPGFVAQGGDPLGDGTGGPGYYLPDEQNDLTHEAGIIAMARTGDGRVSGSQFYITYTPQPQLDSQGFTVFGKVIAGQDVLQTLTAREPGGSDASPGDVITSIDINES